MKTIRIDLEVYGMIKQLAIPLEDTPNSVLKRVLKSFIADSTETKSSRQYCINEVQNTRKVLTQTSPTQLPLKLNSSTGVPVMRQQKNTAIVLKLYLINCALSL
jgi:hypothetical protein